MDNGGGLVQTGVVSVKTTSGRGITPEEWAETCLQKIIHVGDDPLYPSPIRDQALAYQDQIRKVLVIHMRRAIQSDRTTLYNLLLNQGEKDIAEILRKL